MEFAVPGFVKRFCTPNAVLTFMEYLEDYAGPETRKVGLLQIEKELARIEKASVKEVLLKKLEEIKSGKRDLFL